MGASARKVEARYPKKHRRSRLVVAGRRSPDVDHATCDLRLPYGQFIEAFPFFKLNSPLTTESGANVVTSGSVVGETVCATRR